MPLTNKFLRYSPEITLDIFTLVWNKLIECGLRPVHKLENAWKEFSGNYNYFFSYCDNQPNQFELVGPGFTETTVQEILGYDPFVKEEFVLPEKWCIRWRDKEIFQKTMEYFGRSNLLYSNLSGLNQEGEYISNCNKSEFHEITFDQFKKYVLKEPIEIPKEIITIDDLKRITQELINLGFRAKIKDKLNFIGFNALSDLESKYYSEFKSFLNTLQESQPKQQLKQAVHCRTQEEYKAVKEFYGKNVYVDAFNESNCYIPLDNTSCTESKEYYIGKGYTTISFQEWCDLNGYKMGKEVKFEVGDLAWISSKPMNGNGMDLNGKDDGVYRLMDLDSPEFATGHLLENSHFKFKCGKNHFKTNIKNIRHATPEEINNYLVSIGQIPAENPLGFNEVVKLGNNFTSNSGIGLKTKEQYGYFKEPNSNTNQSLPKMILSIDDEELPMVNTIKTKTVNLLNLE